MGQASHALLGCRFGPSRQKGLVQARDEEGSLQTTHAQVLVPVQDPLLLVVVLLKMQGSDASARSLQQKR